MLLPLLPAAPPAPPPPPPARRGPLVASTLAASLLLQKHGPTRVAHAARLAEDGQADRADVAHVHGAPVAEAGGPQVDALRGGGGQEGAQAGVGQHRGHQGLRQARPGADAKVQPATQVGRLLEDARAGRAHRCGVNGHAQALGRKDGVHHGHVRVGGARRGRQDQDAWACGFGERGGGVWCGRGHARARPAQPAHAVAAVRHHQGRAQAAVLAVRGGRARTVAGGQADGAGEAGR